MSNQGANLAERPSSVQRYHAFLSHNGAEKSLVEELASELERRGLSCWLDKWNLIPGDPWQPAIEEALGRCDNCVVFFGPHGLGPWHNEEMRLAIQRRVSGPGRPLRVLPVILPGGQRAKESEVPGFLQGTTWVKFGRSIEDEEALHLLECGIRGIAPGRPPGVTVLEGECPYLGLKTFQPGDAPLFFGRTAKIEELVDRLREGFGTHREERLLALIGASGSGKSSLALAGLIPSITRGELPGSADWPLVRCRPGARPWESLQIALAADERIAPHLPALASLIVRPEDEQRRLHLTARLALQNAPETDRLFVLIDQFEEIFTLCRNEGDRRPLIDNILYASSVTEGRTIVVLTMRADFYGQCASYPGLRAAISDHQSLIGPLSEAELREVIEEPARMAGGELEPGLMELLLADMTGQPGGLPFLGDALFKLWEKRDGRRLTAKAYTDMGRLAGALDTHAEEFFTKHLTLEEQALCHQLLLDLVHPGEGAADTKKRVATSDLATTEEARAVLRKLEDVRLVTATGEKENAQAELAHEALISGWRRLHDWVNENRDRSRLKERLLDSAREWHDSGKGGDFLYRGTQLAAAEETFAPNIQSLPQLAREFLEASVAERNRAKLEKQRQQEEKELQHQRELENQRARAKAEEERAEAEKQRAAEAEARRKAEEARANAERSHAEKQTRAASKMRRLAFWSSAFAFLACVIAILALGLGIYALVQKSAAEEALRKSFVRTIGVSRDANPSADERVALWELSELGNQNVRKAVIKSWLEDDADYMIRAVAHNSRGLHAAIGLNTGLVAYFNPLAKEAAATLKETLREFREIDSDRLAEVSDALAALAARMNSKDAATLADDVATEALKQTAEADADRLLRVGFELKALAVHMDPVKASSVAASLVNGLNQTTDPERLSRWGFALSALAGQIDSTNAGSAANDLAKAMSNPAETDSDRLSRLSSALAALAGRLDPADAARLADELVTALELSPKRDSARLEHLGLALAALAAQAPKSAAASVTQRGATVLAEGLRHPQDSGRPWRIGDALVALAAYVDAKDAASFAQDFLGTLEDSGETDPDRMWNFGRALAAFASPMEPSGAASMADRLIDAMKRSKEANSARLWSLGDALAALAARMEPSSAAKAAQEVINALKNSEETNEAKVWGLGSALKALAARVDPKEATDLAQDVVTALNDSQPKDFLRLAGFGDALAKFAERMPDDAAAKETAAKGALVLAMALERAQEADSLRLSRLGSALAALAERMESGEASDFSARGALVLAKALASEKETKSDQLSRLGEALAALAVKFDSGPSTRLVALSNLLLGSVSSKDAGNRILEICKRLDANELTGVLKWPFCVGKAQKLIFAEIKTKAKRKELNQPAQRPDARDALKELGAT